MGKHNKFGFGMQEEMRQRDSLISSLVGKEGGILTNKCGRNDRIGELSWCIFSK